jgi:hypothetical protein
MAILLDDQARAALAHRRARGRETALLLHLVPLRGMQRVLEVGWLPRLLRPPGLVLLRTAEADIYTDPCIARYAAWRDVRLSAWHLGPWERLAVVDEPEVVLAMATWEQTHQALGSLSPTN